MDKSMAVLTLQCKIENFGTEVVWLTKPHYAVSIILTAPLYGHHYSYLIDSKWKLERQPSMVTQIFWDWSRRFVAARPHWLY